MTDPALEAALHSPALRGECVKWREWGTRSRTLSMMRMTFPNRLRRQGALVYLQAL